MTASTIGKIPKPGEFGTDTIADRYEARVVRHDVRDMYTKRLTDQTPLEAATWSKEASSPYPPAALLALAALSAAGDTLGVGLYGAVFALAILFLLLSLVYFLQTRWYLFPLLYVNFSWVAERFFYVQDGSYLVMLVLVIGALFAARRSASWSAVLMAAAAITKFSPIYFARYVPAISRRTAIAFVAILVAGLVLPYFIWDNYLYIFRYNSDLKGSALSTVGGAIVAAAMALLIERTDRRAGFDLTDRIGWSLVPVALFLAVKMNSIRHLLLVLLVPDKRGVRNIAAAVGLALYAVLPLGTALNSMLPVVTVALVAGLLRLTKSGSIVTEKE